MAAKRVKLGAVCPKWWIELWRGGRGEWRQVEAVAVAGVRVRLSLEGGEHLEDYYYREVVASKTDPTTVPNGFTVPEWDDYFLGVAEAVSRRAKCRRRQVGAVLVGEDHRILSTGYNGFPAGVKNSDGTSRDCLSGGCPRGLTARGEVAPDSPYTDPKSRGFCAAIHAEANSLLHASGREVRGSTLYVTDRPCPDCMRLVAGAGVARAVWPQGSLDPMDFYREDAH